jgi:uncharacterized iron-regulated protein
MRSVQWRLMAILPGLLAVTSCIRFVSAPTPSDVRGLRVHESASNHTVAFSDMVNTAAEADIVFFGEQHDDPETHFAEFALLEGIGRLRQNVVLSLEMFERDVQPVLDDYLAGRMSEADFLAKSRPWDRYATDYRPLVVLARARGWPVVAANVPRPIASAVGRKGLAALDSLPPASRAHAARDNNCLHDRYYDLFVEQMQGHTMPDTGMVGRFYAAQCVKDETMGESVANALARAGGDAIVVHFDGSFHSDNGLGTVARALRRAPNAKHVIITAVPVADPVSAKTAEYAQRADFVIFTQKPAH